MSSNNNTTTSNSLTASIKAIEENVAAILKNTADTNEKVTRLEAQFNKQFAPSISEQEMTTLAEETHEAAISRFSNSVRKVKFTGNPDYRGRRTIIAKSVNDEGKQVTLQDRYNDLFQQLNKIKFGDTAVPLTIEELSSKRLELKQLARAVKKEVIDEEHLVEEEKTKWSDLPSNDREYYQLLLEDKAAKKGIDIFLCKKMWCAKNTLQETIKGSNLLARRREQKRKANEQALDDFSLGEEFGLSPEEEPLPADSPIRENVLSPLPVPADPAPSPLLSSVSSSLAESSQPRRKRARKGKK